MEDKILIDEEKEKLHINISCNVINKEHLNKYIKLAQEIQKEHNCSCTLNAFMD